MRFLESYGILNMNEEEDYEKSPPHMKSNVSPSAKAEGFVIYAFFFPVRLQEDPQSNTMMDRAAPPPGRRKNL